MVDESEIDENRTKFRRKIEDDINSKIMITPLTMDRFLTSSICQDFKNVKYFDDEVNYKSSLTERNHFSKR